MDIKCVVCGEPWDSYGVNHGDMEAWEADLFKKGAGCPSCCGKGEWEAKDIQDFTNGDEDEMERLNAYENRSERPEWKKPEVVQPERGCVYEAAHPWEIKYVDLDEADGNSIRYRDVHERGQRIQVIESGLRECIMPEYLTYNDSSAASTGLIEASNYRAFKNMFANDESVIFFHDGYGGHGIGILTTCDNEEIADTLRALKEYPLLDEELHAEMTAEAIEDAWDSWAGGDFQKLLLVKIEDEERDVDELDFVDEELHELFDQARDISGAEWINEVSDQMYIDLERVANIVRYEKTDDGYVFGIKGGDARAYATWSEE